MLLSVMRDVGMHAVSFRWEFVSFGSPEAYLSASQHKNGFQKCGK